MITLHFLCYMLKSQYMCILQTNFEVTLLLKLGYYTSILLKIGHRLKYGLYTPHSES
jgi:hypothetical protein